MPYKELDVVTRTTLLTEISTLKPHEVEIEKNTRMVMIGPGGQEYRGSQRDLTRTTYTY